ncbi:MAG: hypothetical protein NT062_10700 [Proteobacteria bacterium]|nr:hypothetical protein [Pseudomonadota bacterium]
MGGPPGAWAQPMPPITLIDGMSQLTNAGLLIQTKINNDLADALQAKSLTKFQNALSGLRKQMPAVREVIARTKTEATRVIDAMGKQDQSTWAQSQRDELARAQATLARCNELETSYRAVATDLDAISQHSVIAQSDAKTFARMNKQWFKDRLATLRTKVSTLGNGVAGATGQPAIGSGPTTTASSENAPMMTLANQSKDVWFRVEGVWLKPGDKPMTLRGDRLVVQAVAMTANRTFVMNKGPTSHTTIVEQGPYAFRFSIDTGAGTTETSWQSKDETYTWNVLGPDRYPPGAVISTTKRPQDTATFNAPSLRKVLGNASQTFTFNVRGELTWDYARSGAAGTVKRTDHERFGGALAVTVLAR